MEIPELHLPVSWITRFEKLHLHFGVRQREGWWQTEAPGQREDSSQDTHRETQGCRLMVRHSVPSAQRLCHSRVSQIFSTSAPSCKMVTPEHDSSELIYHPTLPGIPSITLAYCPITQVPCLSPFGQIKVQRPEAHWPDFRDHSLHPSDWKWQFFCFVFFMVKLYTGTLILHRSLSQFLFVIRSLKVQLRESYQISLMLQSSRQNPKLW